MERTKKENHAGHRQRLLKKMLAENDLLEHEILEALLFYVFKRRNTNDVAHNLLASLGGIKNILSAPMERLEQVEGVGKNVAQFLHTIGKCVKVAERGSSATEEQMSDFYDVDRFADFIREAYYGMQTEVLDFYMLDKQGNVFKRRRFFGEKARVKVEPFSIAQMVLENAPSGIIAVHNHPGGTIAPSLADDEMTKACQIICSSHKILFCDHVIITKDGLHSYYSSGEMQRISEEYSLTRLVSDFKCKRVKYADDEKEKINVFKKNLENFTIKKEGDRYVGVIEE